MSPNLPARQSDPHGPTGVPLSKTPTEALAFALGYITASPVSAEQYGGVCALVEEIMRRSVPIDMDRFNGGAPNAGESLWNVLLAYMPPQLARAVQTLYMAHRGQRMAARHDATKTRTPERIIEHGHETEHPR